MFTRTFAPFFLAISCWGSLVSPGRAADDAPPARGRAEHVVIMVWDGMRPDFVSEEHTPTLAALAREGATFTRHHSVYPTSTEVNGTALATGCFPRRSGILGNREFRPELDPVKPVSTEALDVVRRGDALSGGKYLGVPTLPELLHAAGRRTAVAGTKPVALLWDRAEREDPALPAAVRESPVVFAGVTLPARIGAEIAKNIGYGFPPDVRFPNVVADGWTTRALTETLWRDGVPALSVLWMSDPDFTQHQSGPGSGAALAALKSNDANLRRVLDILREKGLREKTDVIVVSDHGFSTVSRGLESFEVLKAAGLPVRRVFDDKADPPKPGEILVCTLGGSVALYVVDHEPASTRRLVEFLQRSDFAGVIFTREPFPGTFGLDVVKLDHPRAPDVLVAMRWDEVRSELASAPGNIVADGRKAGQGTHATLSPYDLHNTCIAAGPDFRAGFRDEAPSGNVDVAPTVAFILGVSSPDKMDGRVLREALTTTPPLLTGPVTTSDTSRREHSNTGWGWRQELKIVTADGVLYLDQGNGGPVER